MRQIGHLPNQADAQRFAAYLVTQGIDAHAESDDDRWILWVRDEDQTQRAKQELDRFAEQPGHGRYEGVEQAAQRRLLEEERKRKAAAKNVVEVRDRWQTGVPRRIPLTRTLIVMSFVVTLAASELLGPDTPLRQTVQEQLYFINLSDFAETRDPLVNIKRGEIWRLVTPAFLHADPLRGLGILHILFNMYWVAHFGGMVETRRGTGRLAGLVLLVAVVSNVAQATFPSEWGGAVFFGGMSGVLYGLFGFVWMKSRYDPSSGLWVEPTTVVLLVAWLFICLTGWVGSVANVAHFSGIICGMLLGVLPPLSRWSSDSA